MTVYCFSGCECLFSPIFLHSGGGRCQPRMVLVMMLPPQCRALTLRLCQLWCVTTAWVTGCSSEGEPEVWGESDASLTLSDQQDQLGNQTLKRRDRSPYILIQRIENKGRRQAGSLICLTDGAPMQVQDLCAFPPCSHISVSKWAGSWLLWRLDVVYRVTPTFTVLHLLEASFSRLFQLT